MHGRLRNTGLGRCLVQLVLKELLDLGLLTVVNRREDTADHERHDPLPQVLPHSCAHFGFLDGTNFCPSIVLKATWVFETPIQENIGLVPMRQCRDLFVYEANVRATKILSDRGSTRQQMIRCSNDVTKTRWKVTERWQGCSGRLTKAKDRDPS